MKQFLKLVLVGVTSVVIAELILEKIKCKGCTS